MKLTKHIQTMEKEKDTLTKEANEANAKYFKCLEEIKLKNNIISELQRKNVEMETKLKQQQNL